MTRMTVFSIILLTSTAHAEVSFIACTSEEALNNLIVNMWDEDFFTEEMLNVEGGSCRYVTRHSYVNLEGAALLEDQREIFRGPGFASEDCTVEGCSLDDDAFGYINGTFEGAPVFAALEANIVEYSRLMAGSNALLQRASAVCSSAEIEQAQRSVGYQQTGAHIVQQMLSDRGYYTGPIDGDFGPLSEAALSAWINDGCP